MAKATKSTTQSRPRTPPNPVVRRAVKNGLLLCCIAGGLAAAVFFSGRQVKEQLARSDDPPQVVLLNRPAWMTDDVAEMLTRSIRPRSGSSAFDSEILRDAAAVLQQSPWVRRVNSVRRTFRSAPGDTLEIDCEFRAPLALVRWQDYYWLVDGDGYKLPQQYTAAQAPELLRDPARRTHLRIIEGVQEPPVESGQHWSGEDLAAGLELARLFYAQRFADEIVKIDVSNFAGRVDPREAQLVLVTQYGSEIRWGRPVGAKDSFVEIPAGRKLEAMQRVFQEYHRVDGNQPWLDIRFDQITHPSAAADGSR